MKSKSKEKWLFKDMQWEDFISEPFLKIYNLDKVPCIQNVCKKNCSDNLFCLNKLGGGKWMNGSKEDHSELKNDSISETNFAAGLKNYGNTCYFNSLLQVYFNILKLRERIFRFPTDDIPDDIINYLQTIFAQMQLSVHKSVDPVELINALELPQLEQQDAPEFHSLFLNLLDERFSMIEDEVIKHLFDGSLGYITRCLGCGYKSTVTCLFREIDLKPMFSFDNAMNDFLKVEMLTGDNKYQCSLCSQKCDGERQTVLLELPPLLCFQFLRYSYDNSGIKKKNCSNVSFPNQLSMKEYLFSEHNEAITDQYIIRAILIHIGTQPTSGHYQTLVHGSGEEWILYDDLNVRKLNSIDDVKKILDKKKLATVKVDNTKEQKENNQLISSNAYMIFYERKDYFQNNCDFNKEIDVPCRLKEDIHQINQSFLNQLESQQKQHEEERAQFLENTKLISKAFMEMPVTIFGKDILDNSNEVEFLPTEWLQSWLEMELKARKSETEEPETAVEDIEQWKPLLCPHGRLGPDVPLNKLKIVKSIGVDILVENGFLPSSYKRRQIKEFCRLCWRLKFELKKFEYNSKNDVEIDNCGKGVEVIDSLDQDWHYISKNNLRQWRKIIRTAIENKYNDSKVNIDDSKSDTSSVKETPTVLNSDLLCPHNKLSIDKTKRTIIPNRVWFRLLEYFPDKSSEYYVDFPYNTEVDKEGCSDCVKQLEDLVQKCECEKVTLSKVFNSKKRFDCNCADRTISANSLSEGEIETVDDNVVLYLVPASFITSWKKFIKSPSLDTLVTEVDYSDIFCQHGNYLSKDWFELLTDESLFVLFSSEWDKFSSYYPDLKNQTIKIITDKTFSTSPELISTTSICEMCSREWNESRLKFENSEIFIRLISENNNDEPSERSEEPIKKKMKVEKIEIAQKSTKKKEIDLNSLRRSTRSKRQRNDTSLRISSSDTVRDMKVRLMHVYKVSPIDQHLIFNERELTDTTATVSEVGIKPASILHLILDTTRLTTEDFIVAEFETGFTGTKLMESLR